MRPSLPRPNTTISLPRGSLQRFVAILVILGACRAPEPRVIPGPPLAAEGEISVDTMQVECDALLAALETWKVCPNLDPDELETVDAWLERAKLDFAAGQKAKPEDKAQQAIAARCRKATDSVKAATERCASGPRPKS